MKKLLSAALVAVLTVAMAATALADPSPKVEFDKQTNVQVETQGVKVDALAPAAKQEFVQKLVTEEKALLDEFQVASLDDLVILEPIDVTINIPEIGYADVVFNIAGVTKNDVVIAIHQKADGTLEYIRGDVLEDGRVSFRFTSASPVSFAISIGAAPAPTPNPNPAPNPAPTPGETTTQPTTEPAAKTDSKTSPKTGDNGVAAAAIVALLAVAGIAVVSKKSVQE